MTTARVIDTQRLSTVAHEFERGIVRFYHDLTGEGRSVERIRQEAAKAPFAEIRYNSGDHLRARIGAGKHVILMEASADAAGIASMMYASTLIEELGMSDDFTLWVAASLLPESHPQARIHRLQQDGIHPDCVLLAEPTNLCIRMREASMEGFLSESHALVQAAIATYEELFELPPIVAQSPSPTGPVGMPAIAFGAGEVGKPAPVRHLLKAAQFFAAFPRMYVETLKAQ
jgi:hypothetical protein